MYRRFEDGELRRIWVLGTSGSGKTRLAVRLAEVLGLRHVELDALQHGPGWAQATPEELLSRARAGVDGDAWVVDGNYEAARGALMGRAQLVVWLDLERPLVMARVVRRTASRLILRRELWNGNRETAGNLLDRDHPIWWAWRTHHGRRRTFLSLMDERWVRLRTREAVTALLISVGAGSRDRRRAGVRTALGRGGRRRYSEGS